MAAAAAAELWETMKKAIHSYTGLYPATFFTAVAVAAALYYVVSGFLAPPPPPPRRREMEPEAEPLPPPVQLGEVTEEELKAYDGSDPKKPLLMAIKGQIYDVSQSRLLNLPGIICPVATKQGRYNLKCRGVKVENGKKLDFFCFGKRIFYGPGGPYALFAGKDASRALAKMSFEPQDLTGDISGLGPFELDALQDWEYKFMSKYVKVGTVKKPEPAAAAGDAGAPAEDIADEPATSQADGSVEPKEGAAATNLHSHEDLPKDASLEKSGIHHEPAESHNEDHPTGGKADA